MGDLLDPAHVADVQQAVDALLDLDEGAVVGQVANDAADDGAGRILLGDLVPGLGWTCFMPSEISCLSLLMLRTCTSILSPMCTSSLGWLMRLRPAHLADVDQTLDARLQLDEGAVAHDVDDFAGVPAADGVLLVRRCPRGSASCA